MNGKTQMAFLSKPLTLILIIFIASFNIAQGQTTPVPAIKSVKAFLYYNENQNDNKAGGTISENIIDNKDFSLRNVIIGEGAASGPSKNTLIVVEIIQNNSETSKGLVKLIAYDVKGKIILSQEQPFSILVKDNVFSAPFMIYGTGCEKIRLKIQIMDQSKKKNYASSEKTLDFSCGE